jgi:hypothetical protein
MSVSTTMSYSPVNPSLRTRLLAALSGVVLLALLLFFAVGLPDGGEDSEGEGGEGGEGTSETAELAPLPESLPGDLLSLVGPEVPPEVVAQSGGAEQLQAVIDSATANLAELFGEPTAFGIYGRVDGSALVTVTVGPGSEGLYVPDGAPVDADVQQAARSNLEVVEVGDAVCSVLYTQAVPAGQPVDPEEVPARVQCRLAADGLAYDVTAQGLDAEQTVAVAEAVRDPEAADEDAPAPE